jgi:hypothetical protein
VYTRGLQRITFVATFRPHRKPIGQDGFSSTNHIGYARSFAPVRAWPLVRGLFRL